MRLISGKLVIHTCLNFPITGSSLHESLCSGKVLDNVHLYPIPTPSDQDHRDGDLVSIHEKICSILSNIKHQDTHAISEKERRDVKEWRNQQMVSVFITQLNTAYA